MGCCNCQYLCENNKREGKCCGAVYYCSKQKKYVNGAKNTCDEYSRDYSKSMVLCNEIYEDGRKFYDDDKDPIMYLIILIIMVVLAVIIRL